jgi:hypothetical protein
VVPSLLPLGEIIRNRNANGRIVKWSIKLGEFEIDFPPGKRSSCRSSQTLCLSGQKSRCPLPKSGLNTG